MSVRCGRVLGAGGCVRTSMRVLSVAALFLRAVVGESWAADLFDIKTGTTMLTVTTPTDAAGAAMQCPELEYPSPPASRRRLGGAAADEEKDLWYLRSTQERAAARRSLATSKPCVFMHGLGHDKNGNSKSSFKDYWGDVHKWCVAAVLRPRVHTHARGSPQLVMATGRSAGRTRSSSGTPRM